MIDKAADQRMGQQPGRRHALVDHLWPGELLHQCLTAAAGPLAPDVAVYEELGRHHVEPLTHVLTHAHHRLCTRRDWAERALWFSAMFDAAQVLGQGLVLRLDFSAAGRRRSRRWARLALQTLQRGQLGLQAGLVPGQRLLEQLALFGVHGFGLCAKTPGLQARQLEGDALELCVLDFDVAYMALDVQALHADVGQHLVGHFGQGARAQALKVIGLEGLNIKHMGSVPPRF